MFKRSITRQFRGERAPSYSNPHSPELCPTALRLTLHWLLYNTSAYWVLYKIVVMSLHASNTRGPVYFSELLSNEPPTRILRSSGPAILHEQSLVLTWLDTWLWFVRFFTPCTTYMERPAARVRSVKLALPRMAQNPGIAAQNTPEFVPFCAAIPRICASPTAEILPFLCVIMGRCELHAQYCFYNLFANFLPAVK